MHSLTFDPKEPLVELAHRLREAEPGSIVFLRYPPVSVNCVFDVDTTNWPDQCVLDKEDRSHAIIPFEPFQKDKTVQVKVVIFGRQYSIAVSAEFVTATFALTYWKAQGQGFRRLILDLCCKGLTLAMVYVSLTRSPSAKGLCRLEGDIEHVFKLKRDADIVGYLSSLQLVSRERAIELTGLPLEGLREFSPVLAAAFLAKQKSDMAAAAAVATAGKLAKKKGVAVTAGTGKKRSASTPVPASMPPKSTRRVDTAQLPRQPTVPLVLRGAPSQLVMPAAPLVPIQPPPAAPMLALLTPQLQNYGSSCFVNASLQALLALFRSRHVPAEFTGGAVQMLQAAVAARVARLPELHRAAVLTDTLFGGAPVCVQRLAAEHEAASVMSIASSVFLDFARLTAAGAPFARQHRRITSLGWAVDRFRRVLDEYADGSALASDPRQECAGEYITAALTTMLTSFNVCARMTWSGLWSLSAEESGPGSQQLEATRAVIAQGLLAFHNAELDTFTSLIQPAFVAVTGEWFSCPSCGWQRGQFSQHVLLQLPFQVDAVRATVQGMFDARFMMPESEVMPHILGPDHEFHGTGACVDAAGVLLQRFIVKAPALICIEAARFGDDGVKVMTPLRDVHRLQVGGHVLSELPARGYSLIASVKHHGPSILQGHYTATIRTNAGWMICDDLAEAVIGPFAHDSVILDYEHRAAMLLFYEADEMAVEGGAVADVPAATAAVL